VRSRISSFILAFHLIVSFLKKFQEGMRAIESLPRGSPTWQTLNDSAIDLCPSRRRDSIGLIDPCCLVCNPSTSTGFLKSVSGFRWPYAHRINAPNTLKNLPDSCNVFDGLLKAANVLLQILSQLSRLLTAYSMQLVRHPNGYSSLTFAFANIIAACLFQVAIVPTSDNHCL
jgi:hypothetical protein